MRRMPAFRLRIMGLLMALLLTAACNNEPETDTPPLQPTMTSAVVPTAEVAPEPVFPEDPRFVTVATDAPNPPFEAIDEFGAIVGFDADIMQGIALRAGLEYEFVVTPLDGLFQSVVDREFQVIASRLVVPETPPPGIAFTRPYLEVGQVLVVLANNLTLTSYQAIQPANRIGVIGNSSGQAAAENILALPAEQLQLFERPSQAMQALINGQVEGVILDSINANYYTITYSQQLKLADGNGPEAWIDRKAYALAVAAENEPLLARLNEAIALMQEDGAVAQLTRAWLVDSEAIEAGESLVGTPDDELIIGMVGNLEELDPASLPNLLSWDIKRNVLGGLYTYNANNELEMLLISDAFSNEDFTEYTFRLKPDLLFPDGTPVTAEDVRWSVLRSARLGNWLINAFLKDVNEDGFADDDAIRVLDPFSIKFELDEPASHFPSLLAMPPYAVLSDECYAPFYDPSSVCGGVGPYVIELWEAGKSLWLRANPDYPGEMPAFPRIQIRFYDSSATMRQSLERGSIDIAWTGLDENDFVALRDAPGLTPMVGPAVFKSYLVFVHDVAPWNDARIRQAAALAVDREALANGVFAGTRLPLYSPLPDQVPGHVAAEPTRDLEQARALLASAGFTPENPLAITLWYINDGRYTVKEEAYAAAIKSQLEETGVFQVGLQGAPWDIFRNEKSACNYPAFLLGWPSPGQPVDYLDAMSWLYFFVFNTDTLCSNYESAEMTRLLTELDAADPNDLAARLELYRLIQELWAEDLPALDLTQTPAAGLAQARVSGLTIDAMGLLRYDLLTKEGR